MVDWIERQADGYVALSVIVLGEIRAGIERLRPRDPAHAARLEAWLVELPFRYRSRILPFDEPCAQAWGRISAGRSVPYPDAMMAATALVHGLTFVTRNMRDVAGLGIPVLDPFE